MNIDYLFGTMSITSQMVRARAPWMIQFPEQNTSVCQRIKVYGILTVLPARLFLQFKTYGLAYLVNNGTYP